MLMNIMRVIFMLGMLVLLFIIVGPTYAGEDLAQTVKNIETARPYVWEIAAVCAIFASLTITQWTKKQRWFPLFMCELKQSRPRDGKVYEYKQLRTWLLDLIALFLTFIGVTVCLYQRYPQWQVAIIGFLSAILQQKIVKIILSRARDKDNSMAAILREGLYVPDDATKFMKTVAVLSGGGVDARNNPEDEDKTERNT